MPYNLANLPTEGLSFYGNYPIPQPASADQLAIVDNSGGLPSDVPSVLATASAVTIILPLSDLSALANSQVYKIAVPFAFTVTAALLRVGNPATTAGGAATLTPRIAGTAITGGVISATGTYAAGATQAGTAITGLNVGTAGQTLEIAVSAVTAFTEGTGWVEFTVTNEDAAATTATIVNLTNSLRNALVSLGLIKGTN